MVEEVALDTPDMRVSQDRPRLLWELDWEDEHVKAKIAESVESAYSNSPAKPDITPLMLYAHRLAAIDKGTFQKSLPSVYREIYLEDGASNKKRVDRLLDTAGLASFMLGSSSPLPDIPVREGDPLSWYVHIERSMFEGALELRFMGKRPDIFTRGLYTTRDDKGKALGDLVDVDVPLWTVRFTPDDRMHPQILIGASQRVIALESYPMRNNRAWFEKQFDWKTAPKNITFEERMADAFKRYIALATREANGGPVVFDDASPGVRYMLKYFPSEYLVQKIESGFGMPLSELSLYAAIQSFQALGYRSFAAVDNGSQPSVVSHAARGDVKMPVDYDALFAPVFEKSGKGPFPFRLETNAVEFNLPDRARKNLPPAYVPFGMAFARNVDTLLE